METKKTTLPNGWVAEFTNKGEFRMASEGWDMLLFGPDEKTIKYFKDKIVLVNDYDSNQAQSCIELSDDERYGLLSDGLDQKWIIDFNECKIAPFRVYISHHQKSKYISAFEQPAYKKAQSYVTISGQLLYITFPFYADVEFPKIWDEYVSKRREQLDELYFA